MDGKRKMFIAVASGFLVFLAVTTVIADSSLFNTPLYTFRMEQASSEMNFLPTELNRFDYNAENGYTIDYDVIVGCCIDGNSIQYTGHTCPPLTCETCITCPVTCYSTCVNTCTNTCVNTCNTCVSTCPSTCVSTCVSTCYMTCDNPTCDTC
jgi:hypothetical protein